MPEDDKKPIPPELRRYSDEMPAPQEIHRTIERMDAIFPFVKPVVGLLSNWKVWIAVAAALAFLRQPEIAAALDTILGVAK